MYDATKSTIRVEFAPASYYDNLVTHRLLDYQLLSTDEKPLDTPTSLRDILESNSPDGFLPPLGLISPLANTVGRGGLIITQDHYLILVSRSERVVADANLYDLSVQGSADIHDITARTYDVFTDFQMEAKDELCIETNAWARLPGNTEALWLMGLLRNAAQGGKPDFIFLGKTTDTADTVQKNAARADHSWENRYAMALPPDTTLDALRTRVSPTSNHSPACRATFALLIRWAHEQGFSTIRDISKQLSA